MKKKKLIFILPEYDPDTASHFRYTLELAEAIAEHMNVFLFVEKAVARVPRQNFRGVYAQKFQNPFLSQLERLAVVLWLRLRGYRRAYIHYSYFSGLITAWVMKLTGGRTWYWHCEERARFEARWAWTMSAFKQKIVVDVPFRFLLKSVTVLITCTERMKRYYTENLSVPAKKIEVVYNWIDVAAVTEASAKPDMELREKLKIAPHKKIVLFVHWLSPRKGSRALPELITALLDRRHDLHFLIVGGGPDEPRLRAFVHDHRLESKVTLTSEVPNQDIPHYFSLGTVLMVPSQNEEFGRVNIEAMAMGVPIVATQTLATEALFSPLQKKFTSRPGDVELFAHHVRTLLDDETLRTRLIHEGFKRVEKYDKLPNVNKFLTLFNA